MLAITISLQGGDIIYQNLHSLTWGHTRKIKVACIDSKCSLAYSVVVIASTTFFLAGLKYISHAPTSPHMPEPLLRINTNPMNREKYFLAHKKICNIAKKGKSTASVAIIEYFPWCLHRNAWIDKKTVFNQWNMKSYHATNKCLYFGRSDLISINLCNNFKFQYSSHRFNVI